jgi:hypothetical protein
VNISLAEDSKLPIPVPVLHHVKKFASMKLLNTPNLVNPLCIVKTDVPKIVGTGTFSSGDLTKHVGRP